MFFQTNKENNGTIMSMVSSWRYLLLLVVLCIVGWSTYLFVQSISNGVSDQEQSTTLPKNEEATISSKLDVGLTTKDISGLTVYLNIPIVCPDVGTTTGYIYEIYFYKKEIGKEPELQTAAFPRCGDGTPRTYANEIAKHLVSEVGFSDVDSAQLLEIINFEFDPYTE